MTEAKNFAHHLNTPHDTTRARKLRHEAPLCEKLLWAALRKQQKSFGVSFRRQQPIHPYVVDFVCLAARVVVEIDGMSHEARQEEDSRRDAFLSARGFRVIRFANEDVLRGVDQVVATILEVCAGGERPPT